MLITKRFLTTLLFVVSPLDVFADELDADTLDLPIPQVLTPVRLKQPRTEVPASVTVIDRELIAASGIRELPELLRLVPGMAVGATAGWDYKVSYHGTSRFNSHRMQVLIDGRSIYQAGFATIAWDDIPLAMEDIERIEVVRGPNTAAYGANAFLGSINIITRHPDDSPRWRAKATAGNKSTEDYYASTSGNVGDSSYRVTAAARRDSGFDWKSDRTDRRDSKDPKFVQGRWLVAPMNNWALDFQVGYKAGVNTNDYRGKELELDRTPENEYIDNYFASVNSQHFLTATNSLKWQVDYSGTKDKLGWIGCQAADSLNPAFPDTAQACGDINRNLSNSRLDLDVQDTWLSNGPYKLVTGFHTQNQKAISESYYSGSVNRTTYQLFSNFEYHFLPQWIATLAGSEEYMDKGERAFSPRVALLYLPTENQSFRAIYSEAIRSPDLFENRFKWHQIARNVTVDGVLVADSVDLGTIYPPENTFEKIRSRELGYYGLWFNRKVAFDIKVFNDSMTDLITDPPVYSQGYNPVNDSKVNQTGVETEIDIHLSEKFQARFAASFIDSDADPILPGRDFSYKQESLTPHKSGAIALIYSFNDAWQWSNFYYYQPINDNTFSRWDSRIAKRLPLGSGSVTLAANLQHYFDQRPDLLGDNQYNGPNKFYFTVDLSF
jgi:iron complex outermembrane receptor protein